MRKFRMWQKGLFILLPLCMILSHYTYKKRERISLWWALQSSPPGWAREQITKDFSQLRVSKITQGALDETFQKISDLNIPAFRYRIVNGEIFRKPEADPIGRAGIYDKILRRMEKSTQLPNIDFILCIMDGVPEVYVPSRFWVTKNQAPLLCFARKEDAPSLILIPDPLSTREASFHHDVATINHKYKEIAWESRVEKVFWRGNPTDKHYTEDNYFQKPRICISQLSKENKDMLDAGLCGASDEIKKVLPDLSLIAGFSSIADHLSYKYLPVLDGWMCTYPGFHWRLLSGSVPFKQESDEVQYFYGALKPYVHYLPIKNDMRDLIEKITWARAHDDKCREIAKNARAFAQENLMPNQAYSYFYWVLTEYKSLQEFDHLEVDNSWTHIRGCL